MFLSSYENKLDKKGRVSVPASFRSHLSSLGYSGFIAYPSFNHSAVEACSQDRIEKLSNTIEALRDWENCKGYSHRGVTYAKREQTTFRKEVKALKLFITQNH